MKKNGNSEKTVFTLLLILGMIIGSSLPNFVFADSCVKMSKVDHKIVEDRSSYFMIRFRAKVKNNCEENLSGTAEFVITDENDKRIKNIPGDILSNVKPNEIYKIDQTFPVYKRNYKKGYVVFLDIYKKNTR